MRNKRKNKSKRKTVALTFLSAFCICAIIKLSPIFSNLALVSAAITMPSGISSIISSEKKSKINSALCDTTTALFDTTDNPTKTVSVNSDDQNGDGEIVYKHYGKMNGDGYINLLHSQIRNCTSLSNEEVLNYATMKPEFTIEKTTDPQVLIYHTHATESYEEAERNCYFSSNPTRSTDKSKNMVAVGDAIAEELESAGIGVIHSDELHDYPSYTGSYKNSAETIKKALEEFPSIKVVLDIHRDAIESDGTRYAAVAEINGKYASQIMIISGCDDGTMDYPNYAQNLRLASILQEQIESDNPGLTRPILFDYRKYNQDLSTGGLLFEIGSHGNTLEQSVYTGHLVGKSVAKALLSLSGE